jgi:hypothetical protein
VHAATQASSASNRENFMLSRPELLVRYSAMQSPSLVALLRHRQPQAAHSYTRGVPSFPLRARICLGSLARSHAAAPGLLLRVQLDHTPSVVRIPQRSEDLSAHAEVRMCHVRAFLCLRQRECDSAKFVGVMVIHRNPAHRKRHPSVSSALVASDYGSRLARPLS